jgi:ribonuclease P/MRP protein subunit RPP1
MQLFERLCDEVRVIKKFDVPFVVTTAAENVYEMRTRRQVENFFSFFGCEIVKARQHATRLVRKYYDTRFIMDGFEIEAELEADVKKKG